MASVNRRISTWRSLSAITVAFIAGSIVLSLLPTPETSFTALAQLVDADTSLGQVAQVATPVVKEVAYYANSAAVEEATGDWPMWGGRHPETTFLRLQEFPTSGESVISTTMETGLPTRPRISNGLLPLEVRPMAIRLLPMVVSTLAPITAAVTSSVILPMSTLAASFVSMNKRASCFGNTPAKN